MKLIFAVLRVSRTMGLTRCYKTEVFFTFIKKSQGGNIWGKAPTLPIENKSCMAGNLPDLIMRAQFQDEIFNGYDFTVGRIFHFPIDFCIGLPTVQRYCAACDKGRSHPIISILPNFACGFSSPT